MQTINHIDDIHPFITQETLVVTPNRRLTTYLLSTYENINKQQRHAWPTPYIVDMRNWLIQWYEAQLPPKMCSTLLSTTQEMHLWQKIIAQQEAVFISNPKNIANKLKQAWEFIHLWHIPIEQIKHYQQEDYQWFLSTVNDFNHYLVNHHLITVSQLPNFILQQNTIHCPFDKKKIIFFGFDEFNPSTKKLLDFLQDNNMDYIVLDIRSPAKKIEAYRFVDEMHEVENMANWAYQQYLAGKRNIACVVPALLQNRKLIQRVFFDTFYKNYYFNHQKTQMLFSITGGETLLETPVIASAINLLRAINYTISFSVVHHLLLTPFIKGGISEQNQRAQFASQFRERAYLEVTCNQVIKALTHNDSCPVMLTIFTQLQIFPKKNCLTIKDWITKVTKLLSDVYWPGERTLSSIEYQQVTKFHEALHTLSSLTSLNGDISFENFLSLLIDHLSTQLFQAKNEVAPIQILGVLEAAGQQFDCIWLMGLSNQTWPENPKPNPFLPIEIQRQYQLPHSSAEKELDFSQKFQNRFINSCQEIIFSWPEMHENNHVSPSKLIEDYIEQKKLPYYIQPEQPLPSIVNNNSIALYEPIALNTHCFEADSAVIKKQAECPFQAFAHYRLKAKPQEKINFLTSKKTRGILLHHVLQTFWQKYKSLNVISNTNLEDLTQPHTKSVVTNFYKTNNIHNSNFIELEIKRINQLLIRWLSLEIQRHDFSIYEIEKSHTLFIDKLKLRLRVDRVDKLHNGKLIIIDYKTGLSSERKWFELDFVEPQLPIYCLLFPTQVVGLAFAQVNPESMKFKGLTVESVQLPGLEKQKTFTNEINAFITAVSQKNNIISNSKTMTFNEMYALQAAWENRINAIAHDFSQGINTLSPINEQVCLYCQRQSLCRINDAKRTTLV